MKRFLFVLPTIWIAAAALGEQPQNAAPQQQPQQQGPRSSGAVQIWDDRVFNLGENSAPQPDSRVSPNGTRRFLGPDADYNSGQRSQWLAKCEPLKSVDLRAYRDCFNQEKQRSRDELHQQRAQVEGRSGTPVRNVPVPVDDEPVRVPASDGQMERTEE